MCFMLSAASCICNSRICCCNCNFVVSCGMGFRLPSAGGSCAFGHNCVLLMVPYSTERPCVFMSVSCISSCVSSDVCFAYAINNCFLLPPCACQTLLLNRCHSFGYSMPSPSPILTASFCSVFLSMVCVSRSPASS